MAMPEPMNNIKYKLTRCDTYWYWIILILLWEREILIKL